MIGDEKQDDIYKYNFIVMTKSHKPITIVKERCACYFLKRHVLLSEGNSGQIGLSNTIRIIIESNDSMATTLILTKIFQKINSKIRIVPINGCQTSEP